MIFPMLTLARILKVIKFDMQCGTGPELCDRYYRPSYDYPSNLSHRRKPVVSGNEWYIRRFTRRM